MLVSHRLMRLFQITGTKKHMHLFVPFDAYCAARPGLTPAAAARGRIDAVWAMWMALPAACRGSGIPQLLGYFIDTHIPLIQTDPAPATTQLVYKAGLNPEQQGQFPCTLNMMPEAMTTRETDLRELIRAACPGTDTASHTTGTAPILKLIRKGLPNQSSVRYIRPQFQRCNTTTASRALAVYLHRLSSLGGYPHSTAIADIPTRIRIYAERDSTVFATVAKITSKALYTIVAEPIATVFQADVALMLRVEGTSGVQTYITALTTDPKTFPPMANPPLAKALFQRKVAPRFVVTQIPLAQSVKRQQIAVELISTGLKSRTAFCCRMCGIVHVRTDAPVPRTTKKQIGIALDLADALTPHCNNCSLANFVERITLTGYLTTGCIGGTRREIVPIVVCGKCATITTSPAWHRLTPLCRPCFAAAMRAQTAAITCVCGCDRLTTAQVFTASDRNGDAIMHGPCALHQFALPTATTCPLTPVTVYKRLLERTNCTPPAKRRRRHSRAASFLYGTKK
jgi:hypothetical protein